jgi:SAM-dependent methyltransferase
MGLEQPSASFDDKNVAMTWADAHHYSPAPRHRRRLILDLLKTFRFTDCLDAGCAQPFLIQEIVSRFSVSGFGCDMSDQTMAANQAAAPEIQFAALDLSKDRWPGGRQFDLVVCSEVLEHIPDWEMALQNILAMSRRYLLVTVPSGQVRAMDTMVGHHRHFAGPELRRSLETRDWKILRMFKWGFPIHSFYKRLISNGSPEKVYQQFADVRYGLKEKLLCQVLYLAFFLNVFDRGDQLIVLAEKSVPTSHRTTGV